MAQHRRRCRVATKIYVFDQQIRCDDSVASSQLSDYGGVIANTSHEAGCKSLSLLLVGAKMFDEIEFAAGVHQRLRRRDSSPASIVSIEVEKEKRK